MTPDAGEMPMLLHRTGARALPEGAGGNILGGGAEQVAVRKGGHDREEDEEADEGGAVEGVLCAE